MVSDEVRLQETRWAFGRVAADYDGPSGNNALIQQMRVQMWQTLYCANIGSMLSREG